MGRPTSITIDLAALEHNFNQVKRCAPHSAVIAMVKSNGYGHGIRRAGLALSAADALGVACIEEGLLLREAGVTIPVVLMEGLFKADELLQASAYDFTLIVHHAAQVEMLERHAHLPPLTIWLKIDTGMHRLGFQPEEARYYFQRLLGCESVKKPIGLMTHFAESEAVDRHFTHQQIDLFNRSTLGLPGPRSLANSGAILAWPETHADWVRPGIMLYGASPFSNSHGKDYQLKPVMTLRSELIAMHDVREGERIGYGGTWAVATASTRIGIVGIGYGDGYPRHAKNGTPVLVKGKRCDLVGRVSMDMIAVDLQHQPEAVLGDPVILWGQGLPVEEIARYSDTSGYELLTRITQRVHVQVII